MARENPNFENLLTTPCRRKAITIAAKTGPKNEPNNAIEPKVPKIKITSKIDSSLEK